MTANQPHRRHGFFHRHSLSIVAVALLVLWIALSQYSDPATHLGTFFGNAIADWSGSVVLVLGTKFLLEDRFAGSRRVLVIWTTGCSTSCTGTNY